MSSTFFGNDDLREDVDATVILGNLCKEEGNLPPKLLCLRFSSMIVNSLPLDVKNKMAEDIYYTLRGIVGKRGYEMRRTCGSSGFVTHESDRNLLRICCEHEGSLPRTVPGCVFIRDFDRYHVIYNRCNRKHGQSKFVDVRYCPPRDGGSFDMPDYCLGEYSVLSELTYLKMWATIILVRMN